MEKHPIRKKIARLPYVLTAGERKKGKKNGPEFLGPQKCTTKLGHPQAKDLQPMHNNDARSAQLLSQPADCKVMHENWRVAAPGFEMEYII
jgi:hypothetical protein